MVGNKSDGKFKTSDAWAPCPVPINIFWFTGNKIKTIDSPTTFVRLGNTLGIILLDDCLL